MAKLDLGKVVGDKGADATLNGYNTATIAAGTNITIDQQGAVLTINSTGGGGDPTGPLLNVIPDPYFKLGDAIVTEGVNPKLSSSTNAYASVEDGILSVKNTQATAKGFQLWASFPEGWGDNFKVVNGSKVTLGCYMKIVPANRDTFVPMRWGAIEWNGAKPYGANPYTPGSQTQDDPASFPYDDFVWFQWTVTIRQGSGIAGINDPVTFGLAYLQCQDPNASSAIPTEIQIKQPCIIFNATGTEEGFYDTYRSNEYLNPEVLKVQNIQLTGALSVDSIEGLLSVDTELVDTGRVEYKENFTFPTDGNYTGYMDQEFVLSEKGTIIPLANRKYTVAEWNALTDIEKSLIEIADVYDETGTAVPVTNPVFTLTEWNALTEEQKASIDAADVVED